ncbi:hypothetical protein ABS735_30785 [Streptomyces sp. MMCC 100]|uniref:hypothetical protein n=1 Tax=Streptomyces sp. MMCC 100 TaxID=3163555 RepID=UPI0035985988
MTARRPPRWALVRVAAALEAQRRGETQRYGTQSRVDIGVLARRLGLSRGLTAACLRAAADASPITSEQDRAAASTDASHTA